MIGFSSPSVLRIVHLVSTMLRFSKIKLVFVLSNFILPKKLVPLEFCFSVRLFLKFLSQGKYILYTKTQNVDNVKRFSIKLYMLSYHIILMCVIFKLNNLIYSKFWFFLYWFHLRQRQLPQYFNFTNIIWETKYATCYFAFNSR